MENVMTNGFTELSENEMLAVDGGWDWDTVLGGATLFITTLGVAASLTTPYGWVGIACCGSSLLSGAAMGYGATH